MFRPAIQHPLALSPPPLPQHLDNPLAQPEPPVSRHQHAAHDIHDLEEEAHEAVSALLDRQHQRLDVVLEEDPRQGVLVDRAVLVGHGVLVRGDGTLGGDAERRGGDGVDGGNDGEEVLEFVEAVGRCGDGAVEWVDQRGVEWAEGEFGDDVREIEHWRGQSATSAQSMNGARECTYRCGPDVPASPTRNIHAPSP